jgi:hypothetical protein
VFNYELFGKEVVDWSSPLNRQTKFTDKNCKLEYEKA